MHLAPALMIEAIRPVRRAMIEIEVMQQEGRRSSGGACARMLLKHYGILGGRTEFDISAALGARSCPPSPGAHPDRMVEFLESERLDVASGENGTLGLICGAIDDRIPALVLDSSWGGHWRLVVGYELFDGPDGWARDKLYLADPEHRIDMPTIDPYTGLTVQNARMFEMQWYENRLYERSRERFYILASA